MIDSSYPPISSLLPHTGDKILLDQVIDYSEESIQVTSRERQTNCYLDENNLLPSWVCLEYMAQAIAAFAGMQNTLAGKPVSIGFLLGTRAFTSSSPYLSPKSKLVITAIRILGGEDAVAIFRCSVEERKAGRRSTTNLHTFNAEANIKAFQPEDINQYYHA